MAINYSAVTFQRDRGGVLVRKEFQTKFQTVLFCVGHFQDQTRAFSMDSNLVSLFLKGFHFPTNSQFVIPKFFGYSLVIR